MKRDLMHFPNDRAILSVSFSCSAEDHGHAQLRLLFRSVLGVYVADSWIEKDEIKVRFDIALDDVDFTLHTLIKDLPAATIGPLERKLARQPQHQPNSGVNTPAL